MCCDFKMKNWGEVGGEGKERGNCGGGGRMGIFLLILQYLEY